MEHLTIRANGAQFNVVKTGTGEPLLLLHGWPEFWLTWEPVMERLQDRFTLIAPDLRGFGKTDKPVEPFGPPDHAKDMIALLDAFGQLVTTFDALVEDPARIGTFTEVAWAALHGLATLTRDGRSMGALSGTGSKLYSSPRSPSEAIRIASSTVVPSARRTIRIRPSGEAETRQCRFSIQSLPLVTRSSSGARAGPRKIR